LERVANKPVGAAQAVNEQAFTDLLAPLVQPAYRLAWAMLHDGPAAEDVVQDSSLIAWRKFGRLQDRSRLKGWFLGIVANECRNARRRKWFTRVSLGLPSGLSVVSGEDRVVGRADVRHALRQLPHEDRLVVVLYFYLDMPLADVAVVAGTSEAATRTRLYRAIRRLRPDVAAQEELR
jgi:RNA polymerase sigma-70 factor (ECF subfamily)